MEHGNYVTEQRNEENVLNEVEEHLNKVINKRPYIQSINVKEKTTNSVVIIGKGTDEDDEKIKYTLYFGEDKENLEQQGEAREVERETEEEWNITGLKDNTKYYYMLEIEDRYVKVQSEIREVITDRINAAPVIEEVRTSKDINGETGKNWFKAVTRGTDEEGDKLIYTLKMWKKANEEVNEQELVKGEPTKKIIKENITSGEEVELEITDLEEYTEYVYRIEITDGKDITEGNLQKVRTYCTGTTNSCSGYKTIACTLCNGTKNNVCERNMLYRQ